MRKRHQKHKESPERQADNHKDRVIEAEDIHIIQEQVDISGIRYNRRELCKQKITENLPRGKEQMVIEEVGRMKNSFFCLYILALKVAAYYNMFVYGGDYLSFLPLWYQNKKSQCGLFYLQEREEG